MAIAHDLCLAKRIWMSLHNGSKEIGDVFGAIETMTATICMHIYAYISFDGVQKLKDTS